MIYSYELKGKTINHRHVIIYTERNGKQCPCAWLADAHNTYGDVSSNQFILVNSKCYVGHEIDIDVWEQEDFWNFVIENANVWDAWLFGFDFAVYGLWDILKHHDDMSGILNNELSYIECAINTLTEHHKYYKSYYKKIEYNKQQLVDLAVVYLNDIRTGKYDNLIAKKNLDNIKSFLEYWDGNCDSTDNN